MLISTGMLSEIILAERRLEETPARQERRRIIAVGTTSVRTLESAFDPKEGFHAGPIFDEFALTLDVGRRFECGDGIFDGASQMTHAGN